MTIFDVAVKKTEMKKAAYKLEKLQAILESLQAEQCYMLEDDGTAKEYWSVECEALNELKEAICNMAASL